LEMLESFFKDSLMTMGKTLKPDYNLQARGGYHFDSDDIYRSGKQVHPVSMLLQLTLLVTGNPWEFFKPQLSQKTVFLLTGSIYFQMCINSHLHVAVFD
jgi:hypothetical protein